MPEPREFQGLARSNLVELCQRLRKRVRDRGRNLTYLHSLMGVKRTELVRRLVRAEEMRRSAASQCERLCRRALDLEKKLAMVEGASALATVGVDVHAAMVDVGQEQEAEIFRLTEEVEALRSYESSPIYEVGDVPGKPWMRRIWRLGALWECDVPTEQVKYKLEKLQGDKE